MDQREHPRVRRAITDFDVLVIPAEGSASRGVLTDMSAAGAGVRLAGPEQPRWEPGSRVVLVIGAHQLEPPLSVSAVTLHQHLQEGELRVGLRFVDPEVAMAAVSGLLGGLFNARRDARVKVENDEEVSVAVSFLTGEGERTQPVEGRIDDISARGLSLELAAEAAEPLVEGAHLDLYIRLPETHAELPLSGVVRNRVPLGDRWRVGVELDPAATRDFASRQAPIVTYIERRRSG